LARLGNENRKGLPENKYDLGKNRVRDQAERTETTVETLILVQFIEAMK